MKKQKIYLTLALIFAASLFVIPLVQALLVDGANLAYEDTSYAGSYTFYGAYPHLTQYSAHAQSFTSQQGGYLVSIDVPLKRYQDSNNDADFVMGAKLYTVAALNSQLNNNNVVAVSTNTISSLSLANTESLDAAFDVNDWVSFTFNQTYQLTQSSTYALMIYAVSGNVANGAVIGEGSTGSSTHSGYHSGYQNGWQVSPDANGDMPFAVWVETTPASTPTPTPTPSPTPEAMPNWISDIIDAIIPIFTPLLVIFICGALGWRFAGAWGFFAGINLAIVLMYVVASQYMPLWAIIAVVVIDIGLLFGKVGFDRGN